MLFTLLGGYALVVALMFTYQNRLLFLPTREHLASPDEHGLTWEDVFFETTDGERLHGWWLPARKARGTLLFFHGVRGNLSWRLPFLTRWHSLGFHVFAFDYRGFGKSTGTPSEAGLYRDARAAWHYLTHARGLAPSDIVVLGRSLGGGPATWLVERVRPRALVLEATFTSVPDVAALHYPWLPARYLARNRFDNLARMPRLDVPVLVIHSRDDQVVPFAHGQALYEAAREPKAFLEIRGSHADAFDVSREAYVRGVESFLADLRL
ncbi:MAG: alpha/beta hydrolase [Bacteroidetes bacterium]|nr:MAG: alpha/beta hydrolase [Bacteroidota bacterium]